ncbi:hypothetical protein H7X46_26345 [Pseudonocardia sp. C8]|uniref:hypothetical protein n=1 Tax=Pseudonocardia sp. C8 TaxID=2762759 RepID=UPI0016424B0C|nr:hypothetical protein [Pseudonocardia sp. C8]MBC3194574.1 hypothetical protein [Pseudonocardia sp. C8]
MHEFDHAFSNGRGLEPSIRHRREAGAGWPFPGRHESHAEIREETPIFHALTVGGWRERQRSGGAGEGVRRVHRGTVRTTRRTADAGPRRVPDALAGLHHGGSAPVPEQSEPGDRFDRNDPDAAATAILRRRRDAARAADRAAIAGLLGGSGRHRLTRSA